MNPVAAAAAVPHHPRMLGRLARLLRPLVARRGLSLDEGLERDAYVALLAPRL